MRLAPVACPNCSTPLDAAQHVDGDASPCAGDITVCLYCGFILAFTDVPDGLSLRIFRRDEIEALPADERQSIERAQQIVGRVQRRRSS